MKTSLSIVLVAAAIAVGCSDGENTGQTSPPDGGTQPDAQGSPDASVDASSTPDASSSDVSRADGFIDIFDAFPIPDGPLGGCVTCVRDRCGDQVNQCLNDEACRTGLQCTFTMCLGSGMPDQACVLGCFMNNPLAALSAVAALTCINMSCGASCMPVMEGGLRDAPTPSDVSVPDGGAPSDATPSEASAMDAASTDSGATDATPPGDDASSD
jgi:hypothetical protein